MSAGDRYEGGDRSPGVSTRVALVDAETGRRCGTVSLDLEGILDAARSLNKKGPGATTKPPGQTKEPLSPRRTPKLATSTDPRHPNHDEEGP